MVLNRRDGKVWHHTFRQLPQLLNEGDLLVLNDTRVIPARFASRRKTGGKIEGLFLRELHLGSWEVMLKNADRCKIGERLDLIGADGTELRLEDSQGEGRWSVEVLPGSEAIDILQDAGLTPLPPYIRRDDGLLESQDRERYQTVYASRPGAVAAPTAGLHFTKESFAKLASRGIETATVTLHVGLGTFSPVKHENLGKHQMHQEWYEVTSETSRKINAAHRSAGRIVAVGTTSARVLETVATRAGQLEPVSGWTDLFLYPPADFRATDAMITNFHLPRSTLLMLVAAFCSPGKTDGLDMILQAYDEAVRSRYRFYSYGDAMLIL
jgi:S-adenosylmethionine:tRNA ribosyltransferase-isomerase